MSGLRFLWVEMLRPLQSQGFILPPCHMHKLGMLSVLEIETAKEKGSQLGESFLHRLVSLTQLFHYQSRPMTATRYFEKDSFEYEV